MKKILVINQDDDHLHLIKKVLEKKNLHAKTIKAHEEVIKMVESFKPDAILIDIVSDKEGHLVKQIKELPDQKQTPVIVMVGHNLFHVDSNNMLADDYIKKPFNENTLFEKLKKNLG